MHDARCHRLPRILWALFTVFAEKTVSESGIYSWTYYERGIDDLWVEGTTWVSKEIGTIFFIYFNSKLTKNNTWI